MQPNSLTILCAVATVGVVVLLSYFLKGIIVATKDELAARLNANADRLDKAKAEIVASIQALKDEISNADATSPAIDAALSRLDGAAATLDDLNPDAEPEQPATP